MTPRAEPLLWQRSIPRSCLKLLLAVPNRGWTLLEIGIIGLTIGTLSAMSLPTMMGVVSQSQVKSATDRIKNAFQEAQRQSIRTGKICAVTISATTASVDASLSASPAGCLSSVPILSRSQLTITTVNFPSTVNYSYKGNAAFDWGSTASPPAPPALIVVQSPYAKQQSCITLTPGLGIVRTGTYNVSSSTCSSSL